MKSFGLGVKFALQPQPLAKRPFLTRGGSFSSLELFGTGTVGCVVAGSVVGRVEGCVDGLVVENTKSVWIESAVADPHGGLASEPLGHELVPAESVNPMGLEANSW